MSDAMLSPAEAEAVIDERIEQFGLGSLPKVHIEVIGPAAWRVRWDDLVRDTPAMTREQWMAWLEENVGSLDAGDLETSES